MKTTEELLRRIDERDYLTEREHREYLDELKNRILNKGILRVYLIDYREFSDEVFEIDLENKQVRVDNGDWFNFSEVDFYLGDQKINII